MKKIVIAGGSGFLGAELYKYFTNKNYMVKVLTRNPKIENQIYWDAKSKGDWVNELKDADVVINLTGKSVDCRYNDENKKLILNSRVDSTNIIGRVLNELNKKDIHWINASTATIYKDTRGDLPANTEYDDNFGSGFSVEVAKAWENAFLKYKDDVKKQTVLRISIVLGKNGGAFPVLSKLAKRGICGSQGSGKQWMSWIHIDDFIYSVDYIIDNKIFGAVNMAAPNPLQNKDFNKLLQKQYKPLFALGQSKWMLELGAVFLDTETELVLKSRKVVPQVLLDKGYTFKYNYCNDAISDLAK